MARGVKWIRSHDSWRLRGTESWRHDSGEAEQRAGEQRHDSGETEFWWQRFPRGGWLITCWTASLSSYSAVTSSPLGWTYLPVISHWLIVNLTWRKLTGLKHPILGPFRGNIGNIWGKRRRKQFTGNIYWDKPSDLLRMAHSFSVTLLLFSSSEPRRHRDEPTHEGWNFSWQREWLLLDSKAWDERSFELWVTPPPNPATKNPPSSKA